MALSLTLKYNMIIKIVLFCISIFAVTATAPADISVHNTGVSSTSKQQDSHGNYAFSYDIVDEHGASNSRSETGDAFGNKKGSYTLYDTDGRARTVDYIADEHGFRAVVNTNEPGTAQSYPAGAIINSPYQEPSAPAAPPISIVHEVPAPVAKVSHPIKSVVSHAVATPNFNLLAPTAVFDHSAPVAVAHAAPSTYSTKSIISHHAPVSVAQPVAIPYVHSTRLVHAPKSVLSHTTAPIAVSPIAPLAYSTKSIVSHDAPIKTIPHAGSIAVASPLPYSSKYVISNPVSVGKRYISAPALINNYKSVFNADLGHYGYSHGLLGPRFDGLSYNTKLHGLQGHGLGGRSYNTKLYNYGLQRYGLGGILYGNTYDHGYHRYGYGTLGHYVDGYNYGKDIHDYNGLKSYYY